MGFLRKKKVEQSMEYWFLKLQVGYVKKKRNPDMNWSVHSKCVCALFMNIYIEFTFAAEFFIASANI